MPSEYPGRREVWKEKGREGEEVKEKSGEKGKSGGEEGLSLQHFMQILVSAFRISHLAHFSEWFNLGIGEKFPVIMCYAQFSLALSHTHLPSRSDLIMLIR